MTNNEILQSSLLDILFEKRNKDYGAYALRRTYNFRLIISIIVALTLTSLVLVLNALPKKNYSSALLVARKDSIVVHIIEIPIEKPKEPEPAQEPEMPQRPKEIKEPVEKIARVKFVNKMVIKEDRKVKVTDVPINAELKNKIISTVTTQAENDNKKIKGNQDSKVTGNGTDKDQNVISTFIPEEKAPEFPGGKEALIRFLKMNLVTPEELQVGEKRTVEIRFKVGTDGLVSEMEIFKSGGISFDREVIRVCKKMPRWKPAVQNGGNIAVTYLLPVTFIGVEQ